MIYLVTLDDKHTEPEYMGFENFNDAEKYADKILSESMEAYSHGLEDVEDTSEGEEGCHLWVSPDCGSYSVSICEVEVR